MVTMKTMANGEGLTCTAHTSKQRSRLSWVGLLGIAMILSLSACQQASQELEVVPAKLVPLSSSITVQKSWSAKLGRGSDELLTGLSPAGNGVNVFAASTDGNVVALDAITGVRKWQTSLGKKKQLSGGPGVGGDLVVVGTIDGEVIALDIESGDIRWTSQASSSVLSAPAVSPGLVAVRTNDGRLTAFDSVDGKQEWDVDRRIQGLTLQGSSAPVFAANAVVAGFDNGKIAAVDSESGNVLWERSGTERRGRNELERLADIDSKIVINGEDAFVVGFQGRAMLIALPTGQPVWAVDLSSHKTVALDWNQVFVSTSDDKVVALERRTGVQTWRQVQLDNRKLSAPAVVGNSVVVGDFEGYLHWMSAIDGSFQARVRAGSSAITAPPLAIGEMIYVLDNAGELHAYKKPAL